MDLNIRVIKEPRGLIRIITFIFAILAFSTTSSFDTESTMEIPCLGSNKTIIDTKVIRYKIEYPFNFEDVVIRTKENCTKNAPIIEQYFPMDFSSSAQFFVTVGVLSMLYSLGALVLYLLASKYYETNPLVPLVDLIATSVLTVFWFAGSCAWAAGVSDVKNYTNPGVFKKRIGICKNGTCNTISVGKWSTLYVSLICGFGCVFFWAASIWFVFKETHLHQKPMPMPMGGTTGAPQTFGYGDNTGQNIPQTQFPNQQQPQQPKQQPQQYSGGY